MSRLFLATSFSGHVDYETGLVNSDYRHKIEFILASLRANGEFTVFCAVEEEGWTIKADVLPEVGVKLDLKEIDKCDMFLALLPPDLISAGLQTEVGYAHANGKQVVLATENGSKLGLGYFNEGLAKLDGVAHIEYESPDELANFVRKQCTNK
ncbi:nucleoside 2-deoxyribosyltransferase [Candidatus Saccharibacteria bacterium]|jgi:hypothetical protein|nr:nucleoside 2-deoxyribosyltransferase [Candidatus Saccharibacteria bacterium]